MRKLFSFRVLLVIIILISVYLRFVGTKPGFPHHIDEGISYSAASEMVLNHNLDPLRYDYPSVVPLVNYGFFKIIFVPIAWVRFYATNATKIIDGLVKIPLPNDDYFNTLKFDILSQAMFWSRYITAAFGVGIVILTYLISKRLFGERSGLISTLSVAVNYRQVLNSHLGLPDIYNAFFLLLSVLAAINLWKNAKSRNYIIAAFLAGISLATKYQIFALAPLLLVHIYLSLSKVKIKEKIVYFFKPAAIAVPFIVLLTFVVLNPYHFIKLEETFSWISSVSGKYQAGQMRLYLFPFSYLYRIGIGRIVSWLAIVGVIVGGIKKPKETFLLLSVIFPFFFVTNFYTSGGFYTRNFVTITPLILIFCGVPLLVVKEKSKKHIRALFILLSLLLVAWENLPNSFIVSQEYKKDWNEKLLATWLEKNLLPGDIVAAYDSTPLPSSVIRTDYESVDPLGSNSLAEFTDDGASYAVANLDWIDSNFYWWMRARGKEAIDYWKKPVDLLEETYHAMTMRELTDFTVYKEINPWQAPDNNFIVVRIPKYQVLEKTLKYNFDFLSNNDGWHTENFVGEDRSLSRGDGNLIIPSGLGGVPVARWESAPISVKDWKGIYIEYEIKTDTKESVARDGYLAVSYYPSIDKTTLKDRIAVRLTARNMSLNKWEDKIFVSDIPKNAEAMTVSFGAIDPVIHEVRLNSLNIYDAKLSSNIKPDNLNPFRLSEDNLFLESQGGM